jgi:hypothetical protein
MSEKKKTTSTLVHPGGGGGLWDELAAGDPGAGTATVCSGPFAEALPVEGMTVGEVRRRFGDRLDIDPESLSVLDGHEVGDATVLRRGQTLMFTRRAGEKGRGPGGRR